MRFLHTGLLVVVAYLFVAGISAAVVCAAPPTPINPSPGTTSSPGPLMSSSSVTLSWNASSGATTYGVGVRDMSTNVLVVDTNTGSTSYTAHLTAGKPYRWNVNACNSTGCSSFTTVLYFQTPSAAPGVPVLTLTAECSGTTSQIRLNWTATSGATSYDVYRNGAVYTTGLTGTQFINTAVTAGTTYSYAILARNSGGSTGSATRSATAPNCAAPGVPVLTLTAECNGTASQIRLNWTATSGATSYDVYRNGAVYTTGLTGTQFINTAVTAGTTYSYAILARNSTGSTGSATRSAMAPNCAAPGVPVLTLTAECSGTTLQIRLNWTATSGATSYDVYRNGAVYTTGLTGTQFINTAVTAGTTYSYAILARNSGGSTGSATQSATAPNCAAPGVPVLTLTAECNGTASQIRLNWTATNGATSYDVYRNGAVYTTGLTGTQFINTAVTAGTTYSYAILARNSGGSTGSATRSATAPNCAAPGVPVLTLTAECNGTASQIRLNWTATSGATSYDVYRNGAVYTTGLTGTQFINTAVTAGTAYSYAILARNSSGSTGSATQSATAPNCAAPGVPVLTLTAECNGTASQIRLNWTATSGATSYDVYRNGAVYTTGLTGTQFINTAVTASTTYSYAILARNSTGSTGSATQSATAPNTCGGTDAATFVSETISDGTQIGASQAFTKSWTIRNSGTSTWNSNYRLRWVSGASLSSHSDVIIAGTVVPGSMYTFIVPMTAPATGGTYREDWELITAVVPRLR